MVSACWFSTNPAVQARQPQQTSRPAHAAHASCRMRQTGRPADLRKGLEVEALCTATSQVRAEDAVHDRDNLCPAESNFNSQNSIEAHIGQPLNEGYTDGQDSVAPEAVSTTYICSRAWTNLLEFRGRNFKLMKSVMSPFQSRFARWMVALIIASRSAAGTSATSPKSRRASLPAWGPAVTCRRGAQDWCSQTFHNHKRRQFGAVAGWWEEWYC